MRVALPPLGTRTRKIARYAGFVVLALLTFVFAFQLTFPFHRVKDKVVELLSDKYDVTIGDVERSIIPGKMYFKAVSLRTRATKPDDVVNTLYIERLEVGIGLFALLRGTASVDFDAKIGSGHITGWVALAKDGTSISVVGDDLPSVSLPMREVLGLPMSGKMRFAFELELPNEKNKAGKVSANWTKAEGSAELACPSGCTIGDGKSKLRPKLKNRGQQAFAEGGIDFGKVSIDSLFANVAIKNGKLSITRFDAKSTDGELHVDLEVALAQDLNSSNVTGCLRFNGSEALRKKEAKTYSALTTTGASLGPDNLFHIKLDGQLREVRRIGAFCGAAAGSQDSPRTPPRPNLPDAPELPVVTETPARPDPAPQPPVAAPANVPSPASIPSPGSAVPVTPPPPAAVPPAGGLDSGPSSPSHIPPPLPPVSPPAPPGVIDADTPSAGSAQATTGAQMQQPAGSATLQ